MTSIKCIFSETGKHEWQTKKVCKCCGAWHDARVLRKSRKSKK